MPKAVKVRKKNRQNIFLNRERMNKKHIKRNRFEFSFRSELKK